jgi:hypothetical protein
MLRRGPVLAAAGILGWLIFAAAAPSGFVHDDAFDELREVERGDLTVQVKHPLSEPTLRALYLGARLFEPSIRALRVAQLQNALGFAVAWVLFVAIVRHCTRSLPLTALLAVLSAGAYSSLHFALDPYLFYWPLSMALMTAAIAALLLPTRPGRGWYASAVTCSVAACAFNPMLIFSALALGPFARSRLSARRAVALSLVPAAILAAALAPLHSWPRSGRLYGIWRSHSFETSRDALWHSLVLAHYDDTTLAGVCAGAWLVLVALSIVEGARRGSSRAGWLVAAALAHGLFVAWWDAGQPFFWWWCVWLLMLAWAIQHSATRPRAVDRGLGRALFACAVLVATLSLALNLRDYVLPVAGRDPLDAPLYAEAQQRFSPEDVLVFADSPALALAYYTDLESTGFRHLFADRPAGVSLAQVLTFLLESRPVGGRVFIERRDDGQVALADDLARAGVLAPELAGRMLWGESMTWGERRFSRLLSLARSAPCAGFGSAEEDAPAVQARASGYAESELNADYAPDKAVDGQPFSEWHSEPPSGGWLDVFFGDGRRARQVRVLNAKNPGFWDRATRDYQITRVLSDGRVLSEVGRFPGPDKKPQWIAVPTEGRLVCVRFWVLSQYGLSGGVAELQVR